MRSVFSYVLFIKNNAKLNRRFGLFSLFVSALLCMNSLFLMAQADVSELPESFKHTALSWAGNTVSDKDFITVVKFLITNKIIEPEIIKPTDVKEIPLWIKTPLKWWGMGMISDYDVSKNLEYLISKNIIQVESPAKPFSVSESFGISAEIIKCARSTPGLYVDLGVKITNKNTEPMNTLLIYQLLDSHNTVIEVKERMTYDIDSSDVVYESIEMSGSDSFDSCKVEIRQVWSN